MKRLIKNAIEYTAYAFTVILLLMGVSYQLGWADEIVPENKLWPYFFMAFLPSVLVAVVKELIWADILKDNIFLELAIDLAGTVALVLMTAELAGWLDISLWDIVYLSISCGIVHLCVWSIEIFQDKRNMNELNRDLEKYKKNRKEL